MTKTEALELLKNSSLMEPVDLNGDPVYRHIGESIETETAFNWVVYLCSLDNPDDRTYAFMYYVDKNTREVSNSGAPLPEDYLKKLQSY
ncbi:MAG: hypothetical protein LBH43_10975 [Treponema sp.]|jgi:hypothetical protein|nr:hypothetical protein [Treponema sp.]